MLKVSTPDGKLTRLAEASQRQEYLNKGWIIEDTSEVEMMLDEDENTMWRYKEDTEWNTISGGSGTDTYKVKVDGTDTADYLENKLQQGTNVTITKSGGKLIVNSTGGSAGAGVTVYADLAALKAVNTTSITTVQTVQVTSLGLYKFMPSSTATGDDVNVIQPTTGDGRWIKQSIDIEEMTVNVISNVTVTGTKKIIKENVEKLYIAKKTKSNKVRKVVFFGSSVCGGFLLTSYAASYAGKVQTALASVTDTPFEFSNISVGGDTTQKLIDRFNDVIAENPDLVFIGLSSNNENLYATSVNNLAAQIVSDYKKKIKLLVGLCEQYGFNYLIGGEYAVNGSSIIGWNAKKTLNHDLGKIYRNKYINWMGNLTADDGSFITGTFSNANHPNDVGATQLYNGIDLNLFLNNGIKCNEFKTWKGSLFITTAGTYLARTQFMTSLNSYTVLFDLEKKSIALDNVTLFATNNTLQLRVDVSGNLAVYDNNVLKTTTTIRPTINKKYKVAIKRHTALNLVLIYIDGVLVSSHTPSSSTELTQIYLGNDGITSGASAVGWGFSNLVIYRTALDIGGIMAASKNDYPQTPIEFAHTLNVSPDIEFGLQTQSSGSATILQLAATTSWENTFSDNKFTDTEKEKLANSISGTFTTNDGKTITITGGMVTSIV